MSPPETEAADTSPVGECPDPLKWTPEHQANTALPFVRVIDWSMDSCGATNKSQFVMAGIGLIIACALLDVTNVLFMVPGHTKFGPDLVARVFAGLYNISDVFNQCMLLNCMMKYAAAQVYDEKGLYHWKKATAGMFQSVDCISKYRYFAIVGDDGSFNPGPAVPLPDGLEPFPGPPAPLYSDAALRAAVKALAKRSLSKIVRASLKGKVGSVLPVVGGGALPGAPGKLMPQSVQTSRRARLFMKRRPSESVWREQTGWMILDSVDSVNAALANLQPYSTTPDAGKDIYGQKLKGFKTQFGRYVPPKDVPDEFPLQVGGQSQGLRSSRNASILDYVEGAAGRSEEGSRPDEVSRPPQPASSSDHRWKATRDAVVLTEIIDDSFGGVVPTSRADLRKLADLMPVSEEGQVWDCGKLKKKAVELKQQQTRN